MHIYVLVGVVHLTQPWMISIIQISFSTLSAVKTWLWLTMTDNNQFVAPLYDGKLEQMMRKYFC